MGYHTWATGETATASNFNSHIRNQVLNQVTSGTRPTGSQGLGIYETDTYKTLQYTTATTTWQPIWNMPWGYIGSASVTSSQGSISTVVDVTSATVTWTAVANRVYLIIGQVLFSNTGSTGATQLTITDGSAVIKQTSQVLNSTSSLSQNVVFYETGISSGSTTRKLRIATGSGTTTINSNSTAPAQIIVIDVGPSANPA